LGLFCLQVLIRSFEGAGHDGLVGFAEADVGHAHAAPSSLDGREDAGLVGDKGRLLVEREFEDSITSFFAGEGGEDLVVEAEVRVVHVRTLDGSGELEGETAKEFDV
jgi:hypothetical protein